MKIFTVDFEPVYPVGCGLVIAANNIDEARVMAKESIVHTEIKSIQEVDITKPKIIYYQDGNY